MTYLAHIHRDGDAYGVSWPDVPGCVTYGDPDDTPAALHARAQEALTAHLASLRGAAEPVPPPSRRITRTDAWAVLRVTLPGSP